MEDDSLSPSAKEGESNEPSEEFEEPRLVIALDYGTSFTGVAYAVSHGSEISTDQIHVITKWPKPCSNSAKVLSRVAIPVSNGHKTKSRRSIMDISEDQHCVVHSKLSLQENDVTSELVKTLSYIEANFPYNPSVLEESNEYNSLPWKSSEQIITEYLKCL